MEHHRYKKRGLLFNSALDSRALRAVQHQERRQSRRNDVLSLRRRMDGLEGSLDKARPLNKLSEDVDEKKSRKTTKELGLERYKQLLKWKEQKKKQLEKEKRKRLPSFKTGVVQPDPPKFLVSGEGNDMGKTLNQTPGKATPFKYLVSSSRKFGTTPGTSLRKKPVFHTGVTPAASARRIHQFHTGVTPKETLKRDGILDKDTCSTASQKSEMKENYVAPRTRAMLKRTAKSGHHMAETRKAQGCMNRRRKIIDQDDALGVKPLPATPQPSQPSLLRKGREESSQPAEAHVSTFAPHNFDFNFDMSKVSQRGVTFKAERCSFDSDAQTHERSTTILKSTLDNDSPDETSCSTVSEGGKRSCDPQNDFEDLHTAQHSNKQAGGSKKRVSVATPAKCRTRKSTSCCEGTPYMIRLRPRTPCSRKTRCSLSAHCDPPLERITRSGKKSSKNSRCSVNDAVKLGNEVDEKLVNKFSLFESEDANKGNVEAENEPSNENLKQEHVVKDDTTQDQDQHKTPVEAQKPKESRPMTMNLEDSSVLLTPNSSGHRGKVSWMIDASPWIDKSRRSANKRNNYGTPDFQKIPDDVLAEGSPYLSKLSRNCDQKVTDGENKNSPEMDESRVTEDQTCMKLLPLLEPTSPSCHAASPEIDVWGEVSPDVPSSVDDPTTEKHVTSRNIVPKNLTTFAPDKEAGSTTPSTQTTIKMPTSTTVLPTPSIECKENEEPFNPNQLPNSILPGKSATKKRKSRRSVMFTLQEQENDAAPTFRFPGTPIRASSRFSMGLYSKVDVNTDSIFPWDKNLIELDSPKSERKTAATRKSSKVSLLPGMNVSPVAVQELPVTQDLIGWDTPKKRNSRSAVSSMATPVRRSQRLSKAPVL